LHPWLKWFEETYYDKWIKMPTNEEELRDIESVFSRVGLPGCVSSMDGVHIEWGRAPSCDSWLYIGIEGKPTLAFNVHCTHNLRIIYISPPHYGSRNDKTIVRDDVFVQRLRTDPLFLNMEFTLMDSDGNTTTVKGAYSLCDGGYHQWRETICGFKTWLDRTEKLFGQQCESVRKDIERVFGILKQRFRVLRVPMLWQDKPVCARVFRVCSILRNWLLDHDGHASIGKEDEDWMRADLRDTFVELLEARPTRQLAPIDSDTFVWRDLSTEMQQMESDESFHRHARCHGEAHDWHVGSEGAQLASASCRVQTEVKCICMKKM
jgi:hypothetical protein